MVYADKAINTADPDFYPVPIGTFVDKKYAKQLCKSINKDKAAFDYTLPNYIIPESNSTSHLSIIELEDES